MKKIVSLTDEQNAMMPVWAKKWIDIGLSTERADRELFESSMKKCYEFSNLPWPGVVHWVDSPMAIFNLLEKLEGKKFVKENWQNYSGGQFWVGSWGWGSSVKSFYREICGLELDGNLDDKAVAYENTQKSASWCYMTNNYVIVSEKPVEINLDSEGRLHSLLGPSIYWPDGWGIYSIHGVDVASWIVTDPRSITVDLIDKETNMEVRRVMIDQYGSKDYAIDSGAELIDTGAMDHVVLGIRGSRLWKRSVKNDVPIFVVEMVNSTPESDGTNKHYHVRVDPTCYGGMAGKNVWAAIASTWRESDNKTLTFKDFHDYVPEIES